MQGISRLFSRLLYYLSWPAAVIYIYGSKRTRLLLMSGDQVLVIKGWINDGRWGLPGGGLHKHEDPMTGLLREVKEEIGLSLNPSQVKSLGAMPFREKGFNFEAHYFCAKVNKPMSTKPHSEIKQTAWINRSELNEHNAIPDVLTAMTLVSGS